MASADYETTRIGAGVRLVNRHPEASVRPYALLRYELESLKTYLKRGRLDRALRLIAALRPRHLPVLWNALRKVGRTA